MGAPDPTAPVVAIGDVHGCASLLREALWPHLGSGAELILLGDLIDRSPETDGNRQVLELVRELQSRPITYGLAGVTVLRGNHEQMLLDALAEDTPGVATDLWEWNGGDPAFLPLARDHQDWLQSLPLTTVRGRYLSSMPASDQACPSSSSRPTTSSGFASFSYIAPTACPTPWCMGIPSAATSPSPSCPTASASTPEPSSVGN